jgi:predicted RNA-binding Zn-ribbon protein involved in translation (DUF1610 family)
MTVEFTEPIDKEMEKTKAMMQELSERIEAHTKQYESLGMMIDQYRKEFGKVEPKVVSEDTTEPTKRRSKRCPECGLLCKSTHGMTRHRHVAHGVVPTEKPHRRNEAVQEPSNPAPSPICEKSSEDHVPTKIITVQTADGPRNVDADAMPPEYKNLPQTELTSFKGDSEETVNTVKPPSDVEEKGTLPDEAVRCIGTPPSDVEEKSTDFTCPMCGRDDIKNASGFKAHKKACTGKKVLVKTKTRECEHCHKQVNCVGYWKHLKYCKPTAPVMQDGVLVMDSKAPELEPSVEVPGNDSELPVKKIKCIGDKKKGQPTPETKGKRRCLACGLSIDENASHPYCDKCWKLTRHRTGPGVAKQKM